MNNNWMLLALLLGGLFFLRRGPAGPGVSPGLVGVDTTLPGFSGFDPDSQLF
jgi:hypothetical protein